MRRRCLEVNKEIRSNFQVAPEGYLPAAATANAGFLKSSSATNNPMFPHLVLLYKVAVDM